MSGVRPGCSYADAARGAASRVAPPSGSRRERESLGAGELLRETGELTKEVGVTRVASSSQGGWTTVVNSRRRRCRRRRWPRPGERPRPLPIPLADRPPGGRIDFWLPPAHRPDPPWWIFPSSGWVSQLGPSVGHRCTPPHSLGQTPTMRHLTPPHPRPPPRFPEEQGTAPSPAPG